MEGRIAGTVQVDPATPVDMPGEADGEELLGKNMEQDYRPIHDPDCEESRVRQIFLRLVRNDESDVEHMPAARKITAG